MTTHLQLAITIREQRDNKGAITSPPSAFSSELEWADHSMSYDDASGRRVVLDFANRQHREIDERARTVTTKPLQTLVSFREMEARNRGEHIYSVMKAGGLADNDFAPILAEHQLSVSLPESHRVVRKRSVLGWLTGRPDIEAVERKAQTDMMVGARCLMSISHDGQEQPAAVAAFTHFLRCVFGGHPCLLRQIRDAKRLPASVTLGHLMPMHVAGEITVRVVEPTATPRARPIDGFEERLPLDDSEPIDAILRRDGEASSPRSLDARCSDALGLLQGATPLLGLLTFLELTLEAPIEMPSEIAAAMQSSTDEIVLNFLQLLQAPSDVDDARERLRVLESLRAPAGRMAYLLGAFEAPLYRAVNERTQAVAALTKVVEANPRVTGAWKDLGDLFAQAYDFTRAWLCWERARAIAPTHPLLKDIAAYEQQLEANHPEYFGLV